jgi:hypothetical protein
MDYLLNFSVILFVLWLFYKLLLENTSWHHFKRSYLLSAVIVAASIPLIVVKTITIPAVTIDPQLMTNYNWDEAAAVSEAITLDITFWLSVIYAFGVLVMSWRFLRNLNRLRIKPADDLESYQTYTLVLRNIVTIPHSFLSRIYVDHNEYRSGNIPNVVLEHEKAHLDQRHSWDVLFIELLIIALWFNPLVYLLKFSLKLNHEFLADQSVLRTGQNARDYQRMLLAFAASDSYKTIANTFNFPIIKKRFTIMNTKTSSTSLLLRSLAIIPVIALLVVSCGKEEVEIEEPETFEIIEVVEDSSSQEKVIFIDPAIENGEVMVNKLLYRYSLKNGNVEFTNSKGKVVDLVGQGYDIIETEIEIIEVLEEVTPEDILEYNRLAKKHKDYIDKNKRIMVWSNETQRMKTIWNSMNQEQKSSSEPWPFTGTFYEVDYKDGQIPPPPPPAPAILTVDKELKFIKINDYFKSYSKKGPNNEYYDRKGKLIDTKGKTVQEVDASEVPPPPPPAKKK